MHNPYAERVNDAIAQVREHRAKLISVQERFIEGTRAFYEKLALFDGGTIALSVSFVQFVGSRSGGPRWPLLLVAAWILLALCMGLAMARNSAAARYIFHAYNRHLLEAEIEKAAADMAFHDVTAEDDVVYRDTPEPYDREREIRIAARNKTKYEEALTRAKSREKWNWRFHLGFGIAAMVGSVIGLSLLIAFAIRNIY